MRVLIVEDEKDLAESIQSGLQEEGFAVDIALDAEEARRRIDRASYDVLVVDWMLPGQNGPSFVQSLRKEGANVPVLILTARVEVEDRVQGLDAGADDYLIKPFSFDELVARLRALYRRAQTPSADAIVQVGPVVVDVVERDVRVGESRVTLRPKEFDLLKVLSRRVGEVVAREEIAESVWGTTRGVTDDVINMTVSGLRKHLRRTLESGEVSIETVRGTGYRLVSQGR